jgi:putative transposase
MLQASFAKQQIRIGRDSLFDLLRDEGLLVHKKKRYTKTTDSRHWMRRYPDLVKDLDINRPEQVWVADITYVALEHGYCYLHLITDAYSKAIVGWTVSETLSASSTVKSLKMALTNRKYNQPLLHHSDRGLQYCSSLYTKLLTDSGVGISMTEDGNPYDNAIAERVNGILKDEFGFDQTFSSMDEVNKQLKHSICTYNALRPHMSNCMLTPAEMHGQSALKRRLWHKKTRRTFNGSSGFLSSLTI